MKKIVSHITGLYCLFYTFIMTSGKGSFIINVAFIGLLLALVILHFRLSETAKFDLCENRALTVPIIIMVGYALLTFMWARDSTEALNGLIPMLSGWSIALLQYVVIEDENDFNVVINDLHIYFIILLWIGYQECDTGVYNYAHNYMYELRRNELENFYPAAGFSNTNNYAYAISILLPFVVYDHFVGRLRRSKAKYVLFIIELVTYVWLIINTASRLVMLTFVLFIVFVLFYNARNLQKSKFSLLIFVGILLLLLVFVSIFSSDDGHITNYIANQFEGTLSGESKSDEIRLTLIKAGFKMFLTNPYGVGIGESEYLSDEFYADSNNANFPLHNMLLIILCELGVVGIVAFCTLLYRAVKGLWVSRLKSTLCNIQSGILIASFICYIFMSMAPSNAAKYALSFILFGVWFSYEKICKDLEPELELFSKKDPNNKRKYGYVKPYDREAAIRDHEENLRKLKEKRYSNQ